MVKEGERPEAGEAERPSDDPETIYLASVRANLPDALSEISDETLLDVGNAACTFLQAGDPFDRVSTFLVTFAADVGATTADAFAFSGAVLGGSVPTFCPEFRGELQIYLDTQ